LPRLELLRDPLNTESSGIIGQSAFPGGCIKNLRRAIC
jgi:hypothetical protein